MIIIYSRVSVQDSTLDGTGPIIIVIAELIQNIGIANLDFIRAPNVRVDVLPCYKFNENVSREENYSYTVIYTYNM